jgi:hypothetical protein
MDHTLPLSHHRHRSSLEGIIRFSSEPLLDEGERVRAKNKFYRVVQHYETMQASRGGSSIVQYNRPMRVRLTHEYARSAESSDIFLRAFFQSIGLPIDGEDDLDFDKDGTDDRLGSAVSDFADYLLNNFFFPCKTEAFFVILISLLISRSTSFFRQNPAAHSANPFRNPTSTRGRCPRFCRNTRACGEPSG